MASRTLPGLGLTAFWDLGSSDWKPGMDTNLRTLSALVQLAVLSRTDALPGTPDAGDMYIVPSGAHAHDVAIYDNGGWVYITPTEGHFAWIVDQEELVMFDGTDWEPFSAGVQNLAELLDVDVSTNVPTDGQVLTWNDAESKWEPVDSTGGASALSELTDYDGTPAPSEGQVLTYNDTSDKWEPRAPTGISDAPSNGSNYVRKDGGWVIPVTGMELAMFASGLIGSSEIVLSHVAGRQFQLPSALTGSKAHAGVASTGTAVFSIAKNGTGIGSITFTASATGVFAMASATTFAAGDILTIVGPSTNDGTLADVAVSLLGSLT